MEKAVAIFKSFDEADEADQAYDLGLTPLQRLEILCELNKLWPKTHDRDTDRLQRVYRIINPP